MKLKRILALVASAVALSACTNPLAPSAQSVKPEVEQARAALNAAARVPNTPSAKLAAN